MSGALDAVLPEPEHRIRAATVVAASPEAVWEALQSLAPARLTAHPPAACDARRAPAELAGEGLRLDAHRSILEQFHEAGFRVLISDTPWLLVAAAAGQPWRLRGGLTFSPSSVDEFANFDVPGCARIALSFEGETGRHTTLSTETRVSATDAAAARAFRRYWATIRLGSMLLRACLDRFTHLVPSWLRPEASEDPGCTRGLPKVGCCARSNLYDKLERLVATDAQCAHLIRELCERVWSGEVSREQAVPARCAPHGPPMWPACGNPHGDAGLLPWGWLKFTGPERVQPQETAIEQPGPLARVDDLPEGLELVVAFDAEPDPECQPPAAEVVQRDRFPGQLVDASPRKRRDHRPEP